jgi:hypothetical protein
VIKPSVILEQARVLVEKGWCQEFAAKNANGDSVAAISKSAVRFCPAGAIEHACDTRWPLMPPMEWLWRVVGKMQVKIWNAKPERTQAEAVEALAKARDLALASDQ